MPEYSIKGQQIPRFTNEFVIVGMILFFNWLRHNN